MAIKRVLIIGYGNPLRSDDGAGAYVAERLASFNLPEVRTRSLHQLDFELAEEASAFDIIVLVDAATRGGTIQFGRIDCREIPPLRSSHQFTPEGLLLLVEKVYGVRPEMHLCSIPGETFEFGMNLSPAAMARAEGAVQEIADFIRGCRESAASV